MDSDKGVFEIYGDEVNMKMEGLEGKVFYPYFEMLNLDN